VGDESVHDLTSLNPTGRFSDRAGDYRRHRPDYPEAAIDAILDGLGDPSRLVIADVGAGTGISSRQLAGRGARVIAVEPNAEMRDAAGAHPRVEWREGTAEATGLRAGSVALVLCAQAFHWFRVPAALEEFHRVLAPGGRLVLMWNSRDREDPLAVGYIEAIHEVNGEHPAETNPFDPASLSAGGWFSAPRLLRFPHAQRLDRAGLLGRAVSASYVPREGAPYERLSVLLGELWSRHRDEQGLVTMRYVTKVYRSERLPRPGGR
jgi:SAM-dependent methyltransferase